MRFLPHPECTDRESASQRFGHRDGIGKKLLTAGNSLEDPLKTLETAGAEKPALQAVHHQEQATFVAEFPKTQEIFWLRRVDPPALTLDAFDEDRDRRR